MAQDIFQRKNHDTGNKTCFFHATKPVDFRHDGLELGTEIGTYRVCSDRALDFVLLPVGCPGVIVGCSHALLLLLVPSAVRVHGAQATLLGCEAGASLGRDTDHGILCAQVQGVRDVQKPHGVDGRCRPRGGCARGERVQNLNQTSDSCK